MALLSVGAKMHDGRRDAVRLPSNLKSIRVGKDRERDVPRIEIGGWSASQIPEGFPYSEAVVCIGG